MAKKKEERVVKIPSIQKDDLLNADEAVAVNAVMEEGDEAETEQSTPIIEEENVNIEESDEDDTDNSVSEEEHDDGWVDDEDDSSESEDSEKAKSTSHRSIYDLMEADIMASDISDSEKAKRLSYLIKIRNRKVNIMLTGATGSGKSSTINAMFDMDVAKVGVGVDPETMDIEKFELDNLIIWDTPGLGDGIESDNRITREIVRKLSETDEEGKPLIDMVVVILDASSKDLGTSYDLINKVLIPCLDKDAEKRILVGLNQSDIAMKGKHWDAEKNEPDEVLKDFLEKKAESVRERIKSATGLDVRPVCYCAGYKEDGKDQCKPYNLTKLLYYIVNSIPRDKRLALADNINPDKDNWIFDDGEEDYKSGIKREFLDTIWDGISDGAETGSEIGQTILGIPGYVVGGIIGAAVGAVGGFFSAIFG